MNASLAILKLQMKSLLQYRAAAFAGICTQFFWGIVYVMIFRAFYQNAPNEPISLGNAISFIWLGQALLQLLPWTMDRQIEEQVKSGNVAYELVRPIHLYSLWFTRSLAMRLAPTLLRCLPIFLIGSWLLGLSPPVSLAASVAFSLSVCLAVLLSAAITTLLIISLFWTLAGEGLQRLLLPCSLLLSGLVVPLPLFPNWMQPFLNWQPFRGLMDIPCRLYTGVIPSSEAPFYLAFQIGWILAFVLFGRWLMHRATLRFVIQGG